jgi:maleate isomerase
VLDIQGLNLETGIEFSCVTPSYWKEFSLEINHPEADVILLSCGGIRALDVK